MKKLMILTFCLFSLCASLTSYAKTRGESLDQIVAVVNEDVITRSEFNHALSIIKMQMMQANAATPPDEALRKQVLDQLINKRLQLQIAKQVGVKVTEKDLDETVARIAKQNNISVATLYERLNESGMTTSEYRTEMREQLLMHKLQQQEVVNRINVSTDEINSFMHSQLWQAEIPKEYHLEDVLIPLSDNPSADEIASGKKHANAVLVRLNQGESIEAAAKAETTPALTVQTGDLGFRKLAEIPSAFAEQILRMHAKEVAGPIQTPNGFHVIKLTELRTLQTKPKAPSRKEVEQLLMQRKFEQAVQNWVSKLRSQAFIETNPPKLQA